MTKRKNSALTSMNASLQRRIWQLEKRLGRKDVRSMGAKKKTEMLLTPVKDADIMMRKEGVAPEKAKSIRKTLILHNTILKALRKDKATISKRLVSAARSKTARLLARSLGICRKTSQKKEETRRSVEMATNRKRVEAFYKKVENATCLAGKRDTVKVKGRLLQKHILNDSLSILYEKYLLEYPDKRIGLATFKKLRPKNIVCVGYAKREVCLCQRHQNMALRLVPLRSMGISQSPSEVVQKYTVDEINQKIDEIQEEVHFRAWKQVTTTFKDKDVKRTTLIDQTESRDEFKTNFHAELLLFKEHDDRVITQYKNFTELKRNLTPAEATVQIDFAENYVCKFQQEVSGAYYSKVQVTVHPVVLHFKTPEGKLAHKSVVILSEETAHKATTIFAFLKSFVRWLKGAMPQIKQVHYLSDSPSSQYRNASIFRIIQNHSDKFQIKATWSYFESGHGKGPCDGVGAAVKRSADLALKKGQLIKSAEEFFRWGITQEASAVTYLLVEREEVAAATTELESLGRLPLKGTMRIHSVVVLDDAIYSRETSCFFECCWSAGKFHPTCPGWVKHTPTGGIADHVEVDHVEVEEIPTLEQDPPRQQFSVGDFVVARYNNVLYVGKVTEIDAEEYYVNFMVQCLKNNVLNYRWPTIPDELWMDSTHVLAKMSPPIPSGRYQRTFTLNEVDRATVAALN